MNLAISAMSYKNCYISYPLVFLYFNNKIIFGFSFKDFQKTSIFLFYWNNRTNKKK